MSRATGQETAQTGATSYEAGRSTLPTLSGNCTIDITVDTFWIDPGMPGSEVVYYYLVRALTPHPGSWGADSAGVERVAVCP